MIELVKVTELEYMVNVIGEEKKLQFMVEIFIKIMIEFWFGIEYIQMLDKDYGNIKYLGGCIEEIELNVQ